MVSSQPGVQRRTRGWATPWHPIMAGIRWQADQSRSAARPQPPTVVIIEDDPDIGQMYRLQLQADGYLVHHAADGNTGLEMVREVRPDLVLLDLRLPGKDGFEVMQELGADRELEPIPIVVITNYGEPEMMARARELGAVAYVVKSRLMPAELSAHIGTWLQGNRAG